MPRIGNPDRRRRHFIMEWREFRRLTQQQLADMIDTTKTSISNIENLKAGYTQDSLEAIAEALGTLPAVLLTRPPSEADSYGVIVPIAHGRRQHVERPQIQSRTIAKRAPVQRRKK